MSATDPQRSATSEAGVLSRATNVMMAMHIVAIAAAFVVLGAMGNTANGAVAAFGAYLLASCAGKYAFWTLSKPLAHLAAGPMPCFDRIRQATINDVELGFAAVLPLLIARETTNGALLAAALCLAIGTVLKWAITRSLAHENTREAAGQTSVQAAA